MKRYEVFEALSATNNAAASILSILHATEYAPEGAQQSIDYAREYLATAQHKLAVVEASLKQKEAA